MFQTLREAGGLLQAVVTLVASFDYRKPKVSSRTVRNRLTSLVEKLQKLCVLAMDFRSVTAFTLVSQSIGLINILADVFANEPSKVAEFWKEQVFPSCNNAISALLEENQRILERISIAKPLIQ
jgi:hypothetical protein